MKAVILTLLSFACFAQAARPPTKFDNSGSKTNSTSSETCSIPAKCVASPVENATCFGTKLPYNTVSFSLTGSQHYWAAQEQLALWSAIRSVPKCWAVIQPLLCAVYLPKCLDEKIEKIPYQLCKITRGPCRIVEDIHGKEGGWPAFLDCNNDDIFTVPKSAKCDDPGGEPRKVVKFNTTTKCLEPYLFDTNEKLAYYGDIDGCGLGCRDHRFSDSERNSVQNFKYGLSIVNLILNLNGALTLLFRWSQSSQGSTTLVPNRIVFFMNMCSLVRSIGMLASVNNDDLICRADGTRKLSEPATGDNLTCTAFFSFVYFAEIAFDIWFVLLIYSWSCSLHCWGKTKMKDSLEKQYEMAFHIWAWVTPTIVILVAIFTNAIDADSLQGICHVTMYSRSTEISDPDAKMIIWLVVIPTAAVILTSLTITLAIFVRLGKASRRSQEKDKDEIRKNQVNINNKITM